MDIRTNSDVFANILSHRRKETYGQVQFVGSNVDLDSKSEKQTINLRNMTRKKFSILFQMMSKSVTGHPIYVTSKSFCRRCRIYLAIFRTLNFSKKEKKCGFFRKFRTDYRLKSN